MLYCIFVSFRDEIKQIKKKKATKQKSSIIDSWVGFKHTSVRNFAFSGHVFKDVQLRFNLLSKNGRVQ